jgi:septal ring factor EnvC (AmiA/AmiB activator)
MQHLDPPSHWHSYQPPRQIVATQFEPPRAPTPHPPSPEQLARERRILAQRLREVEQELRDQQPRLKSLQFERDTYTERIATIDQQLQPLP